MYAPLTHTHMYLHKYSYTQMHTKINEYKIKGRLSLEISSCFLVSDSYLFISVLYTSPHPELSSQHLLHSLLCHTLIFINWHVLVKYPLHLHFSDTLLRHGGEWFRAVLRIVITGCW